MNASLAMKHRSAAKPPPARAIATSRAVSAPVLMRTPGACACGGSCPRCSAPAARASIPVGRPDDAYEREADTIAAQVMGPQHDSVAVSAHAGERRVSESRDAAATQPHDAPPVVHDVLREGGRPLDAQSRGFFEPRFGRDLSAVRVHTGSLAERSAQAVAARAYTVGNHMVFAPGEWAPGHDSGRRLIAHELAHTLQQAPGRAPVLHGQFEGPKAPPAPTDCRIDPFAAARVFAGDKTAALQVVSCCVEIPKLGNGCTSQLRDAACALRPELSVCSKQDNNKQKCFPGFKRARTEQLKGQCCPESSTIEMPQECCALDQQILVGGQGQCCPSTQRPADDRTRCITPTGPGKPCPDDRETPITAPGPRVDPQTCECLPESRRNPQANTCCPVGQEGSSGACQKPVAPPPTPGKQSAATQSFDVLFVKDAPQTWFDPKTSYDVSVTPDGKSAFDSLVARLQANAAERVQIEGRASKEKPAADAEYNKRLTDRRATLIAAELSRRKVDTSRLDNAPGQADAGCQAVATGVLSCGDSGAGKDVNPADRKVVAKVFALAPAAPAAAPVAAPAPEAPQP